MTALPSAFDGSMWPIWKDLPEHLHDGLWHYFTEGILPGSFLTGVLSDSFTLAALMAAPDITRHHLHALAILVSNAPCGSCGSHEAVGAWVKQGGHCRRGVTK